MTSVAHSDASVPQYSERVPVHLCVNMLSLVIKVSNSTISPHVKQGDNISDFSLSTRHKLQIEFLNIIIMASIFFYCDLKTLVVCGPKAGTHKTKKALLR